MAGAPHHFERIPLQLVGTPGPAPALERYAFFDLAAELPNWDFEVAHGPVLKEPADGGAPEVRVKAFRGEPPLVLSRTGDYDGARFNQVRVTSSVRGVGYMRVALLREGKVEARSVKAMVPWADLPLPFTFDVDMPAEPGRFDELQIIYQGGNRQWGVVAVELLDRVPGSDLPDSARGPELVTVAQDARLALGLVPSRPLGARFRVPEGARLDLSLAESRGVRHGGRRSRVAISVEPVGGDAGEGIRREHEAGRRAGWDAESFDLRALAGREVELRVEALADGRVPAAWAVGDVVLSAGASPRPSVLLVTSDTHRGDHLGTAGFGVEVHTPVLDALAARGVNFVDAYSTTNVTNPSHIALLTGTHPRDTGILQNNQPLGADAPTLAQAFADAGYRTLAVVSAQHLKHETSGLGLGFDRLADPGLDVRDAEPSIDILEAWLDEAPGQPTFAWLHLFDAHWPYEPPGRFDRAYYPEGRDPSDEQRFGALPEHAPAQGFGEVRDMDFPRAQYRGEISYLDEQLARVFERPRFRDGVTAFVADHGEALGERGIYFSHVGLSPRELHVPLLLAWPDGPRGRRVDASVTHLDLGRTLLDLVGLESTAFPGRSLLKRLDAAAGRAEPRFAIASSGNAAAVCDGDHFLRLHLIDRKGAEPGERHQVELFDLSTDRLCEHDIADERPAVTARLRRGLVNWLQAARDLGWAGDTIEDPALLAQLEQLGYTQGTPEASALFEPDDCEWCARFE